jgi:hypothetical protein
MTALACATDKFWRIKKIKGVLSGCCNYTRSSFGMVGIHRGRSEGYEGGSHEECSAWRVAFYREKKKTLVVSY